jgi:outer membrane protein assembly factor BamB
VVWTLDRDTPYVPSPLLYDGILYFLKTNNGLMTAVDTKTGKPHYQAQHIEGVPNGVRVAGGRRREDLRGRTGGH